MDNKKFFLNNKNNYDSLKEFGMDNNTLIYQSERLPLDHINLAYINPKLFMLNAHSIFSVLYMIELLFKPQITQNDSAFINTYVNNYLELANKKLSNEGVLEHEVDCLGIPIYYSENPAFINSPCQKIIKEIINKHLEEQESGKSKGPRLVLVNNNFNITPEEDPLIEYGKAGFGTFLLIAGTVIVTCIYIAIFIAK